MYLRSFPQTYIYTFTVYIHAPDVAWSVAAWNAVTDSGSNRRPEARRRLRPTGTEEAVAFAEVRAGKVVKSARRRWASRCRCPSWSWDSSTWPWDRRRWCDVRPEKSTYTWYYEAWRFILIHGKSEKRCSWNTNKRGNFCVYVCVMYVDGWIDRVSVSVARASSYHMIFSLSYLQAKLDFMLHLRLRLSERRGFYICSVSALLQRGFLEIR